MPSTQPPDRVTAGTFANGFTLALGGGGARGYAHIGVARALRDAGLRPTRIVGTSMGAVVGTGLAAGRSPEQMVKIARGLPIYKLVGRGARLALFDPRPVLQALADELGDPLIEDLPTPLGITAFDLVSGRPRLITTGRVTDALEVSIAVPIFFPPRRDADGIWSDAGPWEGIPVSLAREWAPELPVIGVFVDLPKPAFLSSGPGGRLLRAVSARLGTGSADQPLTARRYLGLLTERWADPVVDEPPDLRIAPRLGLMNALQFGSVDRAVEIGERDARLALATIGPSAGR